MVQGKVLCPQQAGLAPVAELGEGWRRIDLNAAFVWAASTNTTD